MPIAIETALQENRSRNACFLLHYPIQPLENLASTALLRNLNFNSSQPQFSHFFSFLPKLTSADIAAVLIPKIGQNSQPMPESARGTKAAASVAMTTSSGGNSPLNKVSPDDSQRHSEDTAPSNATGEPVNKHKGHWLEKDVHIIPKNNLWVVFPGLMLCVSP